MNEVKPSICWLVLTSTGKMQHERMNNSGSRLHSMSRQEIGGGKSTIFVRLLAYKEMGSATTARVIAKSAP